MKIIVISISWILGIFIGSYIFNQDIILPLKIIILIIICIITLCLVLRKYSIILVPALCAIALLCGCIRFQLSASQLSTQNIKEHNNNYVKLLGMINNDPEIRDTTVLLHFAVQKIEINDEWQYISGTALIYASKYPDSFGLRDFPYYRYGDIIIATGQLDYPPKSEEFNYADYLARRGIYSIMYRPHIELDDIDQGSKLIGLLYRLRTEISEALNSALHEPEASISQALLLGKRSTIHENIKEALAVSGTMHLIAISGIHITIITGLFLNLSIGVLGKHRKAYILPPLFLLWGYTLITGIQASAVRAAIMASLFLFADYIGRQRSAFTILAFAAMIMLAIQPYILWDISFQLSFAAMSGLILISPIFQHLGKVVFRAIIGEEKAGWIKSIGNYINSSISITISAVIATLPAIIFYFHRISLVSVPATFFTLPVMPVIVVTSASVGLLGLFSQPCSQIAGYIASLFLKYMVTIVKFSASFSLSSLDINNFTAVQVSLTYGIIIIFAYVLNNYKQYFNRAENNKHESH